MFSNPLVVRHCDQVQLRFQVFAVYVGYVRVLIRGETCPPRKFKRSKYFESIARTTAEMVYFIPGLNATTIRKAAIFVCTIYAGGALFLYTTPFARCTFNYCTA